MWAVLAIFLYLDWCRTSFCPYTHIFWQFCWTNYSSTLIYFYRSHDLIRWLLWRHLRAVPKFPLENWRCKTAIMWQSGASAGHLAGDVMDSGGDIVQIVQWSRPLYLVSSETWIPQQHSIKIKQFHTRDVKQRKKSWCSVTSWWIYPPGSWLHRNVGLQTSTQSVVQIKRKIWISLGTRQLGCKIYMTSDIMSAVVEIM